MAGSGRNMEWVRSRLFFQTIGPDKINMLRHVLYFRDMQGILDHMDKHARIIAPKFQAVQEILERELGGQEVATWTQPQGGYFVSLDTRPGCAAAVDRPGGRAGGQVHQSRSHLALRQRSAGHQHPHRSHPALVGADPHRRGSAGGVHPVRQQREALHEQAHPAGPDRLSAGISLRPGLSRTELLPMSGKPSRS